MREGWVGVSLETIPGNGGVKKIAVQGEGEWLEGKRNIAIRSGRSRQEAKNDHRARIKRKGIGWAPVKKMARSARAGLESLNLPE